MDEDTRKRLLDTVSERSLTWRGDKVNIGGWKNEHASVFTRRPGCWACTWETVEQAIEQGGFDGCMLWKTSDAWLGY